MLLIKKKKIKTKSCVWGGVGRQAYFLQFGLLFHQALFPISHRCLALPDAQSSVLEVH